MAGKEMMDWEKKKVALYLRRSEGEKGTTKAQLKRILPMIAAAEKAGQIAKLNRGIVGKDMTKKRRGLDLEIKGDIWNEGDGKSAFGEMSKRPVMMELIDRVRDGQYDGVVFETMDRMTRDPAELGEAGVTDLYRRQGKHLVSLTEPQLGFVPDDPLKEAITITYLLWGGIGKKTEAKKSKKELLTSVIDRGYMSGSMPEFLGRDTKTHGLDYRRAYRLMLAVGENPKYGIPKNTTEVAMMLGKKDWLPTEQRFKANNRWVGQWYKRMKAWDELGVLDDWFSTVEHVNAYVRNMGDRHRHHYKSESVKRITAAIAGYIGYPAGVNPAGTQEFVTFPKPLDIGLDAIASVENPTVLENGHVKREPLGTRKLALAQTQPRAKRG